MGMLMCCISASYQDRPVEEEPDTIAAWSISLSSFAIASNRLSMVTVTPRTQRSDGAPLTALMSEAQ
jgi:hypothetical protein